MAPMRGCAPVFGQIDQFGGFSNAAQRRFSDRFGFTRQRNHAAVMVRVALAVEHENAGHFAHRRDDRVDLWRDRGLRKNSGRIQRGVSWLH